LVKQVVGVSLPFISMALPTLFMPLAFTASAANNNQKASGVKRVGNARLSRLTVESRGQENHPREDY